MNLPIIYILFFFDSRFTIVLMKMAYEGLRSSIQIASIPSQTEPWLHTKASGICKHSAKCGRLRLFPRNSALHSESANSSRSNLKLRTLHSVILSSLKSCSHRGARNLRRKRCQPNMILLKALSKTA